MGKPFFSVVIPTYNTAELVERAIDSVLAQSFTDYEIIVVDDASTDDTAQRLGPRADLTYLRLERNAGPSVARNTGVACARGEWIAFLDSDDLWLPDKLARQYRVAQDLRLGQVSLIFTDYQAVNPAGEPLHRTMRQGFPIFTEMGLDLPDLFGQRLAVDDMTVWCGLDPVRLFLGNFILPSTSIMRRQDFARLGEFDPEYWCDQDTELFLRWGSQSDFACIEQPLALYTLGRVGQITSADNYIPKVQMDLRLRRRFLAAHPEFEQLHPETVQALFCYQYAILGRLQLFHGEYRAARRSMSEARHYGSLHGKNALTYWLTRLPMALLPLTWRLARSLKSIRHAPASRHPQPS